MWAFHKIPEIDFLGRGSHIILWMSAVVFLVCAVTIGTRGFNLGIDFTGGTVIEVSYPERAELGEIRTLLHDAGFDDAQVQHFGSPREVLIRIAPREDEEAAEISNQILNMLNREIDGTVDLRRVEFVGPQVGRELAEDGGLALLLALIAILIYVAVRFEYRFAMGSVLALIHDVVIIAGIFSIAGLQFDLTVLAALLAVIGYSLNDTIVVFDRIRENFRIVRKGTPREVINKSVNQMIPRTLMTSLTTLLVLLSLLILGGEIIRNFAIALILGILIGTYSSIYVAGNSALWLGVSKADLMPPKKEEGSGEVL